MFQLDAPTVPRDDLFVCSTSLEGSTFVLGLQGELDMAGVADLKDAIARAEESRAETILIDLSALEFIDSTGIGVLVNEWKRSDAGEGAGRLRFVRGAGQVEQTMALCDVEKYLPFEDRVQGSSTGVDAGSTETRRGIR